MDLLGYAFFQRALLAAILAGAACAVTGVWILTLRISLVGVCISHAAFAGALFAVLAGLPVVPVSMASSLAAAGVMGPLSDRGRFSPDTAIGLVFSSTLGLAFLFLGLLPGARTEALDLLWGGLLTVGTGDIALLAFSAALVAGACLVFFRPIQAVLFNRELARSAGLRATWFYYLVIFLAGVVVTACLKSVGGLLVFGLMINPAAAAYQLTYRLGRMYLYAALIGVFSGVSGLLAAAFFDLPSGAAVVLFSCLVFLLALIFSPKSARFRPRPGNARGF